MSTQGEGSQAAGPSRAAARQQALEAHLQQQAEQLASVQTQLDQLAQILTMQQQQQEAAIQAQLAQQQAQQEAAAQAAQQAAAAEQAAAVDEPVEDDPLEALPRSLRLEKPPVFEGEMDGDSVSAFVHKLDLLYSLSGLQDTRQRAAFAVTCLTKAAYTWYISMSYRLRDLTWPTLKQDLLDNFRPMDYTYQARQALAQCKQTGNVRGYVRAFRLKLVRCSDVNDEEAMFRFIDGLLPLEQRHVRLAQPADFHQAASIAEQLGGTLGDRPRNDQQQRQHGNGGNGQRQGQHRSGPQGYRNGPQRQGPVPMQLGSQQGHQGQQQGRQQHRGQGSGNQPRGSPPSYRFNGKLTKPAQPPHNWQAGQDSKQFSWNSFDGLEVEPVILGHVPVNTSQQPVVTPWKWAKRVQRESIVVPTSTQLCGCVSSATTSSRLLILPVDFADGVGQKLSALVDSGATNSFVGQDLVTSAGLQLCDAPTMAVTLADGSVVDSSHVCPVRVRLADRVDMVVDCRVVPTLSNDVVLGMDWLQQWNPVIDWVAYTLSFNLPDSTLVVEAIPRRKAANVEVCSLDAVLKTVQQGSPAWFGLVRNRAGLATMEVDEGSGAGGSAPPQSRWDLLCSKFPTLFGEPGTPPVRAVRHRIDVVEGSVPPAQRMYRMSQTELAEVRRQLDIYLEKGWVRPSTSPYGAPILFVRKKDGSLRMCIDYRALNKQTKIDRYPLPRIDDLLDRLCNAKVISSIDLQQGYHQVAIEQGHEFRTAFVSRFGLYEFTVMPFGLCNAPSTFQRLMHDVFHDALDQFVLVYLDDILVYSSNEDEHERHLEWVFERLVQHKLYAKLSKCEFGKSHVSYLGHIVGSGEMQVDPGKVSAVASWPAPTDVKQVQQFLGFANYYNRFIRNFAEIATPISNLLVNQKEFVWGPDQQRSFEALKEALTSAPVLALPDFSRDFIVTTDASNVAIGGTLSQVHGGVVRPVCFFSKKLQAAERNYSVSDRELLAIFSSCQRWRCYLQGKHTVVYTDHEPLKYLHTQPNVSSRQARWLEKLGELSLEIVYLPGEANVAADVLSRYSLDRDLAGDASVPRFDTGDVSLHPALREWLRVVAPGCELHACLRAARQGLAAGRTLSSIVCKWCARVHLDVGEFATRPHRYHKCAGCGKQWQVTPNVQGNPLAVLEPSLVGGSLFVSRLPDQQSTVVLPADLGSLSVEPSFLARVAAAQQDESDSEMARLVAKGRGQAADFQFRTLHGVSLLFRVSDGQVRAGSQAAFGQLLGNFPTGSGQLLDSFGPTSGQLQGSCQAASGQLPGSFRLVIPSSCRQLLLDEAHNSLGAGHFGVAKTLKYLGQRVWWPHMLRTVKRHVRECQVCQRHKDSTQAAPGLLQPLPIPEGRFQCWSMDFITDLPQCNGFNGVFTVVDRLSKFCRLVPVHVGEGQLSAEEVAKLFFANIVVLFDVPKEVLHDRDPRFTGSFWRELWKLLGTRTVFSSAFHPQTDGQTERAHRTLEQVVRCLLAEQALDASKWCEVLPMVEMAINSSVQDSTGKAPFELVFGQNIQQPIDLMVGVEASNDSASQLASRVQQIVAEAKQQLVKAQEWQKRYFDSRHREVEFEVGQSVLLSTRNLSLPGSRKFKQRWVGPFRIVERIGATAYRLEMSGRFSRVHPVFHVSLLKQHVQGGSSPSPPDPVEVDGEEEFEVDSILGHRSRGRQFQYLVHWKGYDHSEDTWVTEVDLQNAGTILSAYKQSVGLS